MLDSAILWNHAAFIHANEPQWLFAKVYICPRMNVFDNTEVAFRGRSKSDLNRSRLLFSVVANPVWVRMGRLVTEWAFRLHLPIRGIVKATIFRQFCGGETIDECTETINRLGQYGIGAILDYSVEGKEDEADFEHTTQETLRTITKATQSAFIPFCVFKVTGLARMALLEAISEGRTLTAEEAAQREALWDRVNRICGAAAQKEVPIFIDAEESWIQPAIDELADAMMERYNSRSAIVYNTFQLYRWDRLAFFQQSHERAERMGYFLGAKLVRGAYMEKERDRALSMGYASPIQPDKASTDAAYDQALQYAIKYIKRISICAGTHNEQSSTLLMKCMQEAGLPNNHKGIYFSQLFGMSDHISFNLSNLGYNVVKYLPYGPVREVLPYLIRRAQENTSVKGQTGRELGLILKEKQRRLNT
jgi:proline dehydrogenase